VELQAQLEGTKIQLMYHIHGPVPDLAEYQVCTNHLPQQGKFPS
jgi:hypothetical protein